MNIRNQVISVLFIICASVMIAGEVAFRTLKTEISGADSYKLGGEKTLNLVFEQIEIETDCIIISNRFDLLSNWFSRGLVTKIDFKHNVGMIQEGSSHRSKYTFVRVTSDQVINNKFLYQFIETERQPVKLREISW